jgi:hypothetical protein
MLRRSSKLKPVTDEQRSVIRRELLVKAAPLRQLDGFSSVIISVRAPLAFRRPKTVIFGRPDERSGIGDIIMIELRRGDPVEKLAAETWRRRLLDEAGAGIPLAPLLLIPLMPILAAIAVADSPSLLAVAALGEIAIAWIAGIALIRPTAEKADIAENIDLNATAHERIETAAKIIRGRKTP